MGKAKRPPKVYPIPKGMDPYSMEEKRKFHIEADKMNFLTSASTDKTKVYLACGAKGRQGLPCRSVAGMGTDHKGYGRCKYHGGNAQGAVTPLGKAAAAKANMIHGLYAQVLSPQEREIFKELTADDKLAVDLKFEIAMLKAKIISYLSRQREKWDKINEKEGPDQADLKTRVWFSTGEDGKGVKSYYHAGTIEDRALDRTLNTLSRLIEKQIRITGDDKGNVLDDLNKELRAASQGEVKISWGGPAQGIPPTRKAGDPHE